MTQQAPLWLVIPLTVLAVIVVITALRLAIAIWKGEQ